MFNYLANKYRYPFRSSAWINNDNLVGWWDFNDQASMFQDRAGTTVVSAVGQSVGRVNNKAPGDANGNKLGAFLRSHDDASRPIFKKSGTDYTHNVGYIDLNDTTQQNGSVYQKKALRGGFFNTDTCDNDGGVSATKFSDLVLEQKT